MNAFGEVEKFEFYFLSLFSSFFFLIDWNKLRWQRRWDHPIRKNCHEFREKTQNGSNEIIFWSIFDDERFNLKSNQLLAFFFSFCFSRDKFDSILFYLALLKFVMFTFIQNGRINRKMSIEPLKLKFNTEKWSAFVDRKFVSLFFFILFFILEAFRAWLTLDRKKTVNERRQYKTKSNDWKCDNANRIAWRDDNKNRNTVKQEPIEMSSSSYFVFGLKVPSTAL